MRWIVLLIVTLLLCGCQSDESPNAATAHAESPAASNDAGRPDKSSRSKVPVEVVEAVREDVPQTFELTGTTELWDEFAVSSEIPGKITAIHCDEGDWVEKGRVLVELDRERREILLNERQAQRKRTEVELDYARKNLERGQALLQRGAISQAEIDSLQQQVRLAESAFEMASISIQAIQDELKDTKIRSPVRGQVSRRHVSLGENIMTAAPLLTVIQYDPIKVVTEIPETEFFQVGRKAVVKMAFDAIPGRTFQGRINRVDSVANAQSGAFQAEIRVANPGHLLRAGMVARLQLPGPVYRNALTAPLDVVVDTEQGTFVFVVKDGLARKRSVRIENRIGDRAILSGDLSPGEKLVTRGNANLTDGAPVEVL